MKITYTPEKIVAEMSHEEAIRISTTMCGTLPAPQLLTIFAIRSLNLDSDLTDIRKDIRICFPVELHLAEKQYEKDNGLTHSVLYRHEPQ